MGDKHTRQIGNTTNQSTDYKNLPQKIRGGKNNGFFNKNIWFYGFSYKKLKTA